MKKLLIPGVTIAAAISLAACGGGGGSGATAAGGMPGGGQQTVSAKQIGGAGTVLVDSTGQALYASNVENASGKVMCTGPCNSFWEPLTVKGNVQQGSTAGGKLAVIKRPDGSHQLTFNGKLLYSFTEDGPDQVTGDGFHDAFDGQQFTWHVVTVGGGGSNQSQGANGGGVVGY
jgi:predicted lipoprotein with Yx(FWY)xxD motif